MSEEAARQELASLAQLVAAKGLTDGNSGNLSIRLNEEQVLITPAGVPKFLVTPECLVKIHLPDGNPLAGQGKPSSERHVHLACYRRRSNIWGIVHSHPVYSTTLAASGMTVPTNLTAESAILLRRVPLVPYIRPGTLELAEAVAAEVHDTNAVLLANHGVVCLGKTLKEAYCLLETLEFTAKIAFNLQLLGRQNPLSARQVQELAGAYQFIG
ncbi:MAG: class II aldolase/adducin family protein [Deinococcus sp.]|nr:class II aldolase/adducin family protein [Deinococcus sp.]